MLFSLNYCLHHLKRREYHENLSCFDSKEAKNKKEIMTRAEKAKAKFIKRDSFDFELVKASFRRGDRDDRDH